MELKTKNFAINNHKITQCPYVAFFVNVPNLVKLRLMLIVRKIVAQFRTFRHFGFIRM